MSRSASAGKKRTPSGSVGCYGWLRPPVTAVHIDDAAARWPPDRGEEHNGGAGAHSQQYRTDGHVVGPAADLSKMYADVGPMRDW